MVDLIDPLLWAHYIVLTAIVATYLFVAGHSILGIIGLFGVISVGDIIIHTLFKQWFGWKD